ncbi:MAG: glycosyltransferase family 39 protein [Verrucomicrobiota bacterium]|nr:glycosyltransferase family 39 protein [Verrucomicrobiota bacterium]
MTSDLSHGRSTQPAAGNPTNAARNRIGFRAAAGVILVCAALLRILPAPAVLPYSDYIDEGYVLNQVIDHLNNRSYDSNYYNYPPLPSYLITGTVLLTGPVYRAIHGHGFRSDLPRERERRTSLGLNYNLIQPPALILTGRLVAAVLSIATVAVVGVIAWRLAGAVAATFAMVLCAFCPSLVIRGSTVIVDTFATFFAVVSIYFADRLRRATDARAAVRNSVLAGVAAGLAADCKYTAVMVFVVTLLTIVLRAARIRGKILLAVTSGFAATVAAICAAPAIVLQPHKIITELRLVSAFYKTVVLPTTYWQAAWLDYELGVLLVVAAIVGWVFMFLRRDLRITAGLWSIFAVCLIAPLASYAQQPFRNLLPLVPLACVAAGILFAAPFKLSKPLYRWILSGVGVSCAIAITYASAKVDWRYTRDRLARIDSRVRAVDWLQHESRPTDRILLFRELVVLPAEQKRIRGIVEEVPWLNVAETMQRKHFDYIMEAEIDFVGTDNPEWTAYRTALHERIAALPAVFTVGDMATPIYPHIWRSLDQRIVIRRASPGWTLSAE